MHKRSGITDSRRRPAYDFSDGARVIVHGQRAVDSYQRVRATDAVAFDAGPGSTGLNWLQSQLELIDTDLTEPLQSVTHPRDIDIETGGGWAEQISAWASNYASTGTRQFGLQGTNNTEVPIVQADVQKGLWKTFIWLAGMAISLIDMKRMEFAAKGSATPPPFTLQGLYDESLKSNWVKSLDYVVYLGWLGSPGLVNNPAIPEFTVPTGASGYTAWSKKTPQEILNDFNLALNTVIDNSAYDIKEAMPTRALVPWSQWAQLTQPMTINGTGSGFTSIKEYVEKRCIAAEVGFEIHPLPKQWLSGMGASQTDRMVVYKKAKKSQYIRITVPMTKLMGPIPTTRIGPGYETIYGGSMSQVIVKRAVTSVYADGI